MWSVWMSIKTNTMVLAAGVSALALMVVTSGAMAQEVGNAEPEVSIFEPEVSVAVDPIVMIDDNLMIDDVATGEPEIIDHVEIIACIDDRPESLETGGVDPIPTGGVDPIATGGVDPIPTGGVDPIATGGVDPIPTKLLETADVDTGDVALLTAAALTPVVSAESAQADASAIPNLCDTAAGQNNKFFCGSYSKK
jgi:hypothetical protein